MNAPTTPQNVTPPRCRDTGVQLPNGYFVAWRLAPMPVCRCGRPSLYVYPLGDTHAWACAYACDTRAVA